MRPKTIIETPPDPTPRQRLHHDHRGGREEHLGDVVPGDLAWSRPLPATAWNATTTGSPESGGAPDTAYIRRASKNPQVR
ncbi:hypothetical protein Afil01_33670 [Actinorhabdospora filicis]|uniref:Uncharacterized protein n=1 Tax=Actinorhabdospora filicis TaxID=1785913 RepID=A0A9W6WBB6_9ACTN|nr:hypothetical protein Afil01_33670 [Actinorhabdospora filicis]